MDANIIIVNQSSGNSLLQEAFDNLDGYLQNITSLRDAFYCNEEALSQHLSRQQEEYNAMHERCTITETDGAKIISVPNAEIYLYKKLQKNVLRAVRATELIPPCYLAALISSYDAFFGGIIRSFYNICPDKLRDSEKTFTYKDLENLQSLKDVKKSIIDKKIDTELRESHIEQLNWLAGQLEVSTLTEFNGFSDFVEITQRRNLFVHADGIVSDQYIKVCQNHKALDENIQAGAKLDVSREYFEKAYHVLYRIGIMLTFTMLNILFKKGDEEVKVEIDEKLIEYIYYMIYAEQYADAVIVSNFALGKSFKHNQINRVYYALNLAQSHKWLGNEGECKKALKQIDWTACLHELQLPKHVLLGDYKSAYACMDRIGKNNKIISPAAYREWPIFKELREEEQFKQAYEKIFGEPFVSTAKVVVEKYASPSEETKVRDDSEE